MRRTLRMALVTGALVSGVVLGLAVTATHAQAPLRPAAGSQYFASTRTPDVPQRLGNPPSPSTATATAAASAGGYYYPSQARGAAPTGGYYYPSQAAAVAPAPYYYPAPATVNPGRAYYYYPNPAAPATGRTGPANIRGGRPQPQPADDDTYAYKS